MRVFIVVIFISMLIHCGGQQVEEQKNRIQPYTENPRYWQYKNEPVLLLGGTKEDDLFQMVQFEGHLDSLTACGGNYIRNTMSSRNVNSDIDRASGRVKPFHKLEEKYDLDKWNPEYWQRFEKLLQATAERDIIVQVEIWAFHDFNKPFWKDNPWRPANNVNYDTVSTTLTNGSIDIGEVQHHFFFSIPSALDDEVLLSYQKKFVDKLLDTSLDYDNVLYCITNEIHPAYPKAWSEFWAKYVHEKAAEQNRKVKVTEMFWQPDFTSGQHDPSFSQPGLFTFFEASQNSANSGSRNGDMLRTIYQRLSGHPRPINNVKIYGSDQSPSWANRAVNAQRRFWRNIFCGSASSRFHRPPVGIGLNAAAQTHIKSMRLFAIAVNIYTARPDVEDKLLLDRNKDEAYLLYAPDQFYAIYFPAAGAVELDLTQATGEYQMQWLQITSSSWLDPKTIQAGQHITLETPGEEMSVVVIKKSS